MNSIPTGRRIRTALCETQQIEVCNKAVEELLTRIDEQIKRTKESEDYGCYSCAAYFLSSRPSKALLAANTYRSLMIGEGSSVESGAANLWQDRCKCNCYARISQTVYTPCLCTPALGE